MTDPFIALLTAERALADRLAKALAEAADAVPCDSAPGECKTHDCWRRVLDSHARRRHVGRYEPAIEAAPRKEKDDG